MIKRFFLFMVAVATMLVAAPAYADFEAGVKAFRSGNYETARSEFLPLAEAGDENAQLYLGELYFSGKGVKSDITKAIKLWAGYIAKDANKAVESLQDITGEGRAAALYRVAFVIHRHPDPAVRDKVKAFRFFLSAAKLGHAEAQWAVGDSYFWGDGVATDNMKALEWYERAAEQGIVDAQYFAGLMYFYGNSLEYHGGGPVERNYVKAFHWLEKAAEQGHPEAQYQVALMWRDGLGIPSPDPQKAEYWWRKTLEDYYFNALFELGFLYEFRAEFPNLADYKVAIDWYRQAVDQNLEDAMFRLGGLYFIGLGTEPKLPEARELVEKALLEGHKKAKTLREVMNAPGVSIRTARQKACSILYPPERENRIKWCFRVASKR